MRRKWIANRTGAGIKCLPIIPRQFERQRGFGVAIITDINSIRFRAGPAPPRR
ncbi:MAG TPA: hypothetical protein VEX11_06745 [Acetobacteraceae bacterium]|nr:hypothetical protein [Acetobacteraceae bacterium]